jgi:hypothetical protein
MLRTKKLCKRQGVVENITLEWTIETEPMQKLWKNQDVVELD